MQRICWYSFLLEILKNADYLGPYKTIRKNFFQNEEISIISVIIELLKNEAERLSVGEKIFKTKNSKNKTSVADGVKDFEDFNDKQKQVCKIIESCYDKIIR